MWDIFKKEFRLVNFGLAHNCRDDFISCQWNWHPVLYVIYRILVAVYVLAFFTSITIVSSFNGSFYFMSYLTVWTYLLSTLHFLFSAIAVVFYKRSKTRLQQYGHHLTLDTPSNEVVEGHNNYAFAETDVSYSKVDETNVSSGFPGEPIFYETARQEITVFMKICWLFGNITQVFAILVTVVYFTAIFPRIGYTNFPDINFFGVNSFLVIIDMCISARPVRLLHVIHPVIYGAIYLIFSGIYWSFDHVNNLLFPGVLDWNYPGTTAIWIVGITLVFLPLLQLVYFGVYRLKLHFSRG